MQRLLALALTALFILGATGAAHAAVWYVANNGVDGTLCGSREAPCRSISVAIARAAEFDRIVVGPGRYGDVNGNGNFDDPGDEAAELQDDPGCGCMVHVNKPLTVESSHGASATVLDAGGARIAVVRVSADAVVFGTRRQGFTLVGGRTGLHMRQDPAGSFVSQVSVESNRSAGHVEDGFSGDRIGPNLRMASNIAAANGRHGFFLNSPTSLILETFVVENAATDNGASGFTISGPDIALTRNFAGGNGTNGFALALAAAGSELMANVASHNGETGIAVEGGGPSSLRDNASIGNDGHGLLLVAGSVVDVRKTAVHGNRMSGIRTESERGSEIARNNIFGNGGGANCGFINASGAVLTLFENFWGAPGGPGSDPADEVCDVPPAVTSLESAATNPYSIPIRVGQ